jgi:hypothetical protein
VSAVFRRNDSRRAAGAGNARAARTIPAGVRGRPAPRRAWRSVGATTTLEGIATFGRAAMIDVFQTIGSRAFSAHLAKDGMVTLMEQRHEVDRVTLATAYAALVEESEQEADLLDATVEGMMRALIQGYARSH